MYNISWDVELCASLSLSLSALTTSLFALNVAVADDGIARKNATPLRVGPAGIEGEFEYVGNVDRFITRFEKGEHYAVFGFGKNFTDAIYDLSVKDPKGKLIASGQGDETYSPGVEFTAASNGKYASLFELDSIGEGVKLPVQYKLFAQKDCDRSLSTSCALPLGQLKKARIQWERDIDWWKLRAEKNRVYSVAFEDILSFLDAKIVDKSGNQVQYIPSDDLDVYNFKATYSGPYFVVIQASDDVAGPYTLRATRE